MIRSRQWNLYISVQYCISQHAAAAAAAAWSFLIVLRAMDCLLFFWYRANILPLHNGTVILAVLQVWLQHTGIYPAAKLPKTLFLKII